jgi:hypothetical protein
MAERPLIARAPAAGSKLSRGSQIVADRAIGHRLPLRAAAGGKQKPELTGVEPVTRLGLRASSSERWLG